MEKFPTLLRRVAMIVPLAMVASGIAAAQSSEQSKPVTTALELTITTDRQVYNMSDDIRIQARLLNKAKYDVYVWKWDLCWNPARGMSVHVLDREGSRVHGNVLFDCVPPPPRPGRVSDFIRLEPQSFYGHVTRCKVSDLVNKTGEYNLDATFSSFLSDSFIQQYLGDEPIAKLNLWTMDNPVLRTRPLHISVTR